MKWNLRLAAAQRGIWKASDLQRMLAEHGLVISAGKMSGLWSGQPASIKLDDLDIICAVLNCTTGDLLGKTAFDVVDWGGGVLTLRSADTGRYLSIKEADASLAADQDLIKSWEVRETFRLEPDGTRTPVDAAASGSRIAWP